MTDQTQNQSRLYHEFFEVVRAFNSANQEYLNSAEKLAAERRFSIQQAVMAHLDPVISTFRTFQIIGVIAVLCAGIAFCYGTSQVNYVDSGGSAIIPIALIIGLIAGIAVAWSSSQISGLNQKKQEALASQPQLPF
jgi:ABC-type multidrug transport system fused ATPase/permease subunit